MSIIDVQPISVPRFKLTDEQKKNVLNVENKARKAKHGLLARFRGHDPKTKDRIEQEIDEFTDKYPFYGEVPSQDNTNSKTMRVLSDEEYEVYVRNAKAYGETPLLKSEMILKEEKPLSDEELEIYRRFAEEEKIIQDKELYEAINEILSNPIVVDKKTKKILDETFNKVQQVGNQIQNYLRIIFEGGVSFTKSAFKIGCADPFNALYSNFEWIPMQRSKSKIIKKIQKNKGEKIIETERHEPVFDSKSNTWISLSWAAMQFAWNSGKLTACITIISGVVQMTCFMGNIVFSYPIELFRRLCGDTWLEWAVINVVNALTLPWRAASYVVSTIGSAINFIWKVFILANQAKQAAGEIYAKGTNMTGTLIEKAANETKQFLNVDDLSNFTNVKEQALEKAANMTGTLIEKATNMTGTLIEKATNETKQFLGVDDMSNGTELAEKVGKKTAEGALGLARKAGEVSAAGLLGFVNALQEDPAVKEFGQHWNAGRMRKNDFLKKYKKMESDFRNAYIFRNKSNIGTSAFEHKMANAYFEYRRNNANKAELIEAKKAAKVYGEYLSQCAPGHTRQECESQGWTIYDPEDHKRYCDYFKKNPENLPKGNRIARKRCERDVFKNQPPYKPGFDLEA